MFFDSKHQSQLGLNKHSGIHLFTYWLSVLRLKTVLVRHSLSVQSLTSYWIVFYRSLATANSVVYGIFSYDLGNPLHSHIYSSHLEVQLLERHLRYALGTLSAWYTHRTSQFVVPPNEEALLPENDASLSCWLIACRLWILIKTCSGQSHYGCCGSYTTVLGHLLNPWSHPKMDPSNF